MLTEADENIYGLAISLVTDLLAKPILVDQHV